jgi:hypothetical protein
VSQTYAFAAQLRLVRLVCLAVLISSFVWSFKFVVYRIAFAITGFANLVVFKIARSTIPPSPTNIAYEFDNTNIIGRFFIENNIIIEAHVLSSRKK